MSLSVALIESSPSSSVPDTVKPNTGSDLPLHQPTPMSNSPFRPSSSASTASAHHIAKKRENLKADKTWSYFREPQGDEQDRDPLGRRLHYCLLCVQTWCTAVSSNARTHLSNHHDTIVKEDPTPHATQIHKAVDLTFEHITDVPFRLDCPTSSSTPSASVHHIAKKRRNLKANKTWSYFREPQGNEQDYDQEGRRLHYCLLCVGEWCSSNSSNARTHLLRHHDTIVTEDPTPHATQIHKAVDLTFEHITEGNKKKYKDHEKAIDLTFKHIIENKKRKYKDDEEVILHNAIQQEAFLEAQTLLVTRRRLPRNFIQWPEFHAILYAVNPESPSVTISASTTASSNIEKSFKHHKETIRSKLRLSTSLIHFAVDLWSASASHAIFGVHVQWVDEFCELRKALIGLPEVTFSHSGKNQAAYLMEVLQDFGISHRVGYFTGDSASSNDTLLEALANNLSVEFNIQIPPKQRRVHCLAHIMNLSLFAFLFANDKVTLEKVLKESIEEEGGLKIYELLTRNLNCSGGKNMENDEYAGWLNLGALGKLYIFALRLKNSNILMDHWDVLCDTMKLGIDNTTQWNSWFILIRKAVSKRDEITELYRICKAEFNSEDALNDTDWEQLKNTLEFLQPFYEATFESQNKLASLDQSLFFIDLLFKQFEDYKVRVPIPILYS